MNDFEQSVTRNHDLLQRLADLSPGGDTLTPRMTETLQFAADGFSLEQTGVAMHVCRGTVKNVRACICERLGADNICQAVAMGIRRKLIQ